jgi:hypothetical protein
VPASWGHGRLRRHRHAVGPDGVVRDLLLAGGGYEARSTNPRVRGVVRLALSVSIGLVTSIEAMWNGALAGEEELSSIIRKAISANASSGRPP